MIAKPKMKKITIPELGDAELIEKSRRKLYDALETMKPRRYTASEMLWYEVWNTPNEPD